MLRCIEKSGDRKLKKLLSRRVYRLSEAAESMLDTSNLEEDLLCDNQEYIEKDRIWQACCFHH